VSKVLNVTTEVGTCEMDEDGNQNVTKMESGQGNRLDSMIKKTKLSAVKTELNELPACS
jgi:hypothetical protein